MRMLTTAMTFLAVVSVFGCGGAPTSPSGTATLSLRIKDSPYTDAQALLVTFSTVSAHRDDSEFFELPFAGGGSTRTCDLKKLAAADDVLGTAALPAGHYTQVRLTVTSATLYFDNPSAGTPCADAIAPPAGTSASVTIPSGEVRLNRQFTLAEDTVTTVLLDFDGDQSVHETSGGYTMTPVIGIVSVQ